MFGKILYTILVIGLLNEVNADRLLGCTSFSERRKQPTDDDKLVIPIESGKAKDEHFITVGITEFSPAMLLLSSCEIGSRTVEVVNETTFVNKFRAYEKESARNLKLDFSKYGNSCISIAEIKRQLEEAMFSEPENPTLYVVLTTTTPTNKKVLKKTAGGIYLLLDDCEKSEGEIKSSTEIRTLIKEIAQQVREAAKIKFTEAKKCLKFTEIISQITKALEIKYKDHAKIGDLAAKPTGDGKSITYEDNIKKFSVYATEDCSGRFRDVLFTASDLEKTVSDISLGEIKRYEIKPVEDHKK